MAQLSGDEINYLNTMWHRRVLMRSTTSQPFPTGRSPRTRRRRFRACRWRRRLWSETNKNIKLWKFFGSCCCFCLWIFNDIKEPHPSIAALLKASRKRDWNWRLKRNQTFVNHVEKDSSASRQSSSRRAECQSLWLKSLQRQTSNVDRRSRLTVDREIPILIDRRDPVQS